MSMYVISLLSWESLMHTNLMICSISYNEANSLFQQLFEPAAVLNPLVGGRRCNAANSGRGLSRPSAAWPLEVRQGHWPWPTGPPWSEQWGRRVPYRWDNKLNEGNLKEEVRVKVVIENLSQVYIKDGGSQLKVNATAKPARDSESHIVQKR
jgi:hypothetical protein